MSVFVTGERGNGMLGLDNFYAYYDLALKRAPPGWPRQGRPCP
jgi:hypothetical protein